MRECKVIVFRKDNAPSLGESYCHVTRIGFADTNGKLICLYTDDGSAVYYNYDNVLYMRRGPWHDTEQVIEEVKDESNNDNILVHNNLD